VYVSNVEVQIIDEKRTLRDIVYRHTKRLSRRQAIFQYKKIKNEADVKKLGVTDYTYFHFATFANKEVLDFVLLYFNFQTGSRDKRRTRTMTQRKCSHH